MKKKLQTLLLALSLTANVETIIGRVVSLADGDKVTVLHAHKTWHKIRLAGIDAPEKKQAFGSRSKESLFDLTFAKFVTVALVSGQFVQIAI